MTIAQQLREEEQMENEMETVEQARRMIAKVDEMLRMAQRAAHDLIAEGDKAAMKGPRGAQCFL
jgi:hypothetical protein